MSDGADTKLPPPTDQEANELCKVGQGKDCCRYLAMGGTGWSCLKLTDLKGYVDRRVESSTMNARGDNCSGKGDS